MLPAPKSDRLSLADVLKSCLSAIAGEPNRLGLPGVDRAIVLLVDGLGADSLLATAGHARTLVGAMTASSVIQAGFPTTTAAALATLATGVAPGQHGLVGYTVLDPANDRIVNQLSGWDDRLDPVTWQLAPTLFEAASDGGFAALAIGPERYRDSGFSRAVLKGARYLAAPSIAERMHLAAESLGERGQHGVVYVYVPELDIAAHSHGWVSREWANALEETDAAVRILERRLGRRDGLLVTADHGLLDVPHRSQVLIDSVPTLLDGVRFVAGDPRCLQLHFEADSSPAQQARLIEAWRAAESHRAWLATREQAIEAGWFGEVRPEVLPRIGDLLVAARKAIAYYDSRTATARGRAMIGQHGSFSSAEVRIPLVRFGAFAA